MIDEKKLIEETKTHFDAFYREDGKLLYSDHVCNCEDVEGVIALIEEQPKVERWIPVEERLPDNCNDVLVWFEYFRYGDYNRPYQTFGIGHRFEDGWSGVVNGICGWKDLKIIAWMPLPEPYRKEN